MLGHVHDLARLLDVPVALDLVQHDLFPPQVSEKKRKRNVTIKEKQTW